MIIKVLHLGLIFLYVGGGWVGGGGGWRYVCVYGGGYISIGNHKFQLTSVLFHHQYN